MEQGNPSMLSEKASFDINLSFKEILGAIVALIGYVVLIVSAKQDIIEIMRGESGAEPSGEAAAPKTAAISILLIVLSNIILARIAVARFRELNKAAQSENAGITLSPNIKITLGSILSAIGHGIEAVGTVERASQPTARVTIV